MATVREYFETDFAYATRVYAKLPNPAYADVGVTISYDFVALFSFVVCYVPGANNPVEFFLGLLDQLQFGKSQVMFGERIRLLL